MEKKTKAIGLFSGGLDSIVSAKLVMEQGIDVELVHFTTVFFNGTVDSKGMPLTVIDLTEEFFDVMKDPVYGYGTAINPCIDCKIFMLKKAGEYMKKKKASFVFTGEVLGQRPFSQRREAMKIIERDSGLEGYLLRPLCAKLFPPTIAEEKGLIDRNKMLSMSGRSRKPQMALAKRFGVENYPASAGGCVLAEKEFEKRLGDLMKYKPGFDAGDIELLKHGRHFRMSPEVKLVVGRNNGENYKIVSLKKGTDLMLHAQEPLGPVSMLRGKADGAVFDEAVSIVARYALGKDNAGQARIKCFGGDVEKYVTAMPCKESLAISRRI
ncbi:MAG: tRNA 4-thiouridine(8) synthase ThiI [Candidatus Omnitrophota bacterium]